MSSWMGPQGRERGQRKERARAPTGGHPLPLEVSAQKAFLSEERRAKP